MTVEDDPLRPRRRRPSDACVSPLECQMLDLKFEYEN
jgi:hypothetical protein